MVYPKTRGPRKETTCSPCRQQKRQCDGRRPKCWACQRLGLACFWPPPSESIWLLGLADAGPVQSSLSDSNHLDDNSRRVLRFFADSSCVILLGAGTLDGAPNYLLDIIPIAHDNEVVMNAILAVGGAHLAGSTGNEKLALRASSFYGGAMRGLHAPLSRWIRGSRDETLAIILFATTSLMSAYEACLLIDLGSCFSLQLLRHV
jgi:hypothetical protein